MFWSFGLWTIFFFTSYGRGNVDHRNQFEIQHRAWPSEQPRRNPHAAILRPTYAASSRSNFPPADDVHFAEHRDGLTQRQRFIFFLVGLQFGVAVPLPLVRATCPPACVSVAPFLALDMFDCGTQHLVGWVETNGLFLFFFFVCTSMCVTMISHLLRRLVHVFPRVEGCDSVSRRWRWRRYC